MKKIIVTQLLYSLPYEKSLHKRKEKKIKRNKKKLIWSKEKKIKFFGKHFLNEK